MERRLLGGVDGPPPQQRPARPSPRPVRPSPRPVRSSGVHGGRAYGGAPRGNSLDEESRRIQCGCFNKSNQVAASVVPPIITMIIDQTSSGLSERKRRELHSGSSRNAIEVDS